MNASERDSVIFVGSGCTGAVAKLIHGLNLNESPIGIFYYFYIIIRYYFILFI